MNNVKKLITSHRLSVSIKNHIIRQLYSAFRTAAKSKTRPQKAQKQAFFFHATPLIIVFSFIYLRLFEVTFYVLPSALVGAGGQLVARNNLLEIKCANSHNLGAKTFSKTVSLGQPVY